MRLIWLMFFSLLQTDSFKQSQMQNVRVKNAYKEKEAIVRNYFTTTKIQPNGCSIFFRAFKQEQVFEVWVKEAGKGQYRLLKTYPICRSSGTLGPKRKSGDGQVPEGVYEINDFNPYSNFHLSLGISYPNASDKILSDRKNPGNAIYIHGSCVTIGCIPLTDDIIKEVYIMAVDARSSGQKKIPIHIFPSRIDEAGMNALKMANAEYPERITFWENLQLIYKDFESTKKIKSVKVNGQGKYYF
jgi:murein L,D-transpeptidase YafK